MAAAEMSQDATESRTAPVLRCRDLRKRFGELEAVAASASRSPRARPTACSARTAPARRRRSRWSAGCSSPTRGEVRRGRRAADHAQRRARRRRSATCRRSSRSTPTSTRARTCASSPGSTGCAGAEAGARVDEVLDVIGLTDRAREQTKNFSGGMQRRLNIGIGLLHRPRLLILDEPTVGVDPQSRNAILESVEQLVGRGDGRPLHDALHGGGRAPVRPDRDRRPRRAQGRGHARASSSRSSASTTACGSTAPGDLDAAARACERARPACGRRACATASSS